jgi:hypothetical protein
MAGARTGERGRADVRRIAAGLLATVLVVTSLAAACTVNSVADLRPGPNEYNVAAWEVRNVPGKWLFLAGQLLRGAPSQVEQDDTLRRFFDLSARIDTLDNETSDALSRGAVIDHDLVEELAALRQERDRIENQVEATLEARLSDVIEDQGLTRDLLWEVVWPPVDAEFTEAPRALARSPRDRIELLGSTLLQEDLTLAGAEAIEEEVARSQDVSALSFGTAGIGAYPTIIDYPTSYERAVEVIAHEWMHNHLFFRPLGFNYYANNDLRTINETVANLVGRELAREVVSRWPLEPPAAEPGPAAVPSEPRLDLRAELVELRGEVDALLAEGRIEDAEALMEQRRQELAESGYFIRKINQAYFAYLNLYAGEAGSPAATNPIGPRVDALRALSPSLRVFVDVVGSVTSVEELDRVLLRLQSR